MKFGNKGKLTGMLSPLEKASDLTRSLSLREDRVLTVVSKNPQAEVGSG